MTGRALRIACSPEGLIRLPHRLADLCTVFNQNSYKTPRTSRHFLHENRETSEMSERPQRPDREAKARRHTASVPASEESDHVIVPRNPSNKDGHPSAEKGEGSAWTKENARPSHMPPTQRGARMSQGLARVRKA